MIILSLYVCGIRKVFDVLLQRKNTMLQESLVKFARGILLIVMYARLNLFSSLTEF